MTPPACDHSLELRGVGVRLGGVPILENVDADVRCGEVTALIGPNGAGKTTLLQAILGRVPHTGTIRFCHAGEHGSGAPRIGYVPQRLDLDRHAPLSVLDFLCLTDQRLPVALGHTRRARARAEEALGRVGAAHLLPRALGRLSGGEMQRVLLGLALRDRPHILLLDEPVSGVDAAGEELFCDFLDELHRESGFSLLLVSHDLSVVARHADRVICLNRTIVCQGGKTEILTPENLAAMYGAGAHVFRHGHAHGRGHLHEEGCDCGGGAPPGGGDRP